MKKLHKSKTFGLGVASALLASGIAISSTRTEKSAVRVANGTSVQSPTISGRSLIGSPVQSANSNSSAILITRNPSPHGTPASGVRVEPIGPIDHAWELYERDKMAGEAALEQLCAHPIGARTPLPQLLSLYRRTFQAEKEKRLAYLYLRDEKNEVTESYPAVIAYMLDHDIQVEPHHREKFMRASNSYLEHLGYSSADIQRVPLAEAVAICYAFRYSSLRKGEDAINQKKWFEVASRYDANLPLIPLTEATVLKYAGKNYDARRKFEQALAMASTRPVFKKYVAAQDDDFGKYSRIEMEDNDGDGVSEVVRYIPLQPGE